MIKEYLTKEHILTKQKATNLEQSIQITTKPLLDKNIITTDYLDSIRETIEKFGLYMIIIPGVAFFHGSHERGVHEVGISLATFEDKLVLSEEDPDKYISAAFCFSAVDSESHLAILQGLVELLSDEDFLELIRSNPNKEEILERINR